ncbi:mycofactocin-coupled SDR family oxidoreductase [Mycolicibacterium sp.]|uniref:mycofactocin-coupled SDR family oxidoreductase n=1 Tax=Mycolicibacterium sp. TaxID=2320850 RepID=UPI0037C6A25C
MGRLDGKVALITGGARGQGRSHALTLAREGADVLVLDVAADIGAAAYGMATPEDLARTISEVEALGRRIIAVEGDVRSQEDLDQLVERGISTFGKIDIGVANAGIVSFDELWKISEDDWATVIDINLSGVWRTVKALAPHMIERREGSLILISSTNAHEGGEYRLSYVAAKHGVSGIVRSAALELGQYGIRVNEVCPGVVDTPMMNSQGTLDWLAGGEGLGTPDLVRKAAESFCVLADEALLDPQRISDAVLWLASEESRAVTGLEMHVDAGHRLLPGINAPTFYNQAYAAGISAD